jgi:cytochrome P450
MCYYPEAQKRAQREIDAVIGSYRLPTFSDRGSLPYVNALIKEVTRWQPVSPIGTVFNSMKRFEQLIKIYLR